MAELEHLPAPKGNFTPGPECYQRCLDWVEECELLLNGPLASKSKAVKANYVLIWAGKTGRTHIKSLNLTTEQKGDPSVLLKKVRGVEKAEIQRTCSRIKLPPPGAR